MPVSKTLSVRCQGTTVGLVHTGAGYEVDAWVAAVFKVGIIDDHKNLLLVHFQDEDAAQAQCSHFTDLSPFRNSNITDRSGFAPNT